VYHQDCCHRILRGGTRAVITTFIICLFACTTETENNTTGAFEIPDAVDFSEATDQQLAIYFDLVKEALEAYYMAKLELKPFPSFRMSTTEYCQKYLEMKFKYESMSAKDIVSLSFDVNDWKITNDSLWCKIYVKMDDILIKCQKVLDIRPSYPH
jgi:hypothetical protein